MLGSLMDSGARMLGLRERRRHDRIPAVAPAFVTVGGEAFPCTTANLSESGAQLVFESAQAVSGIIELRVPDLRLKRQARVVWRDEGRMGVEFVP